MTKDELIDSILSPDPTDDTVQTMQTMAAELAALRTEISVLKDTLTSPESAMNMRVNAVETQLNKQAEMISKQQRFLEDIDRKERECNLILFGVPDDNESLDGATTDEAKVRKVFEAAGATNDVRYDIIGLNEVKTTLRVSLPGYVSYRSVCNVSGHRGGTVVLVKNYLSSSVMKVDTTTQDQVWLQLKCITNVIFGFCYVPPSDSPYYTYQSFSTMQEKMTEAISGMKFCIIGDLNSRFGTYVKCLPARSEIPDAGNYSYPIIPDNVDTPTLCLPYV